MLKKKIPLYSLMDKQQKIDMKSKKLGTLGWRWSYIQKVVTDKYTFQTSSRKDENDRSGKESTLAMKMILSPVRDLTIYPKVMQFLKGNNVYISLTSSPKRLRQLPAVLATIDTNIYKVYLCCFTVRIWTNSRAL